MNNKAHLRPKDYDSNGDIIPMACKEVKGDLISREAYIRPQDEFVKMLNERISDSVCKYCQMNKHCELCEISRVFSIIALTDKEMKGGAV